MTSRRTILRGLIAGSGLLLPARWLQGSSAPEPGGEAGHGAPVQLFAPAKPGRRLGLGWSLESVSPPIAGAVFLTFAHDSGSRKRVRVCRRDGNAVGAASSQDLDFVIMRDGNEAIDPDFGRVVLGVAAAAAKNESRYAAAVRSLSTHREHLAACRV